VTATTEPARELYLRYAVSAVHNSEIPMHGLIYLIGLIVVIMAILSFFGLR
jgi:hypothetical protein